MCIAIIKPRGVNIPDKETLKRCFEKNPHGAGFMYNDTKKVVIHKGFMTFDEFYRNFLKCNEKRNFKNKDVVIHFRITTSGGTSPQTTHPFVICNNFETMKNLHIICGAGFAHNGIISGHGSKEFSDTMEFNKNVISKLNLKDDSIETTLDSLATACGSRFAILTKDKYIKGGYWIQNNGCYYSNDGFKEYKPIKKYYQSRFFTDFYCDFCGEFSNSLTKVGRYQLCEDCYNESDWCLACATQEK